MPSPSRRRRSCLVRTSRGSPQVPRPSADLGDWLVVPPDLRTLHSEVTLRLQGRALVLVGSAEQGVVPIRTYSEDEARSLGLLEPAQLTAGAADGDTAAAAPARRTNALTGLLERLRERTIR